MFKNWFGSNEKEQSVSVLLVSDDETTSAFIYNALIGEGCTVYPTSSPNDAIELLDTIALPDIIIGDFHDPATDGKTFIVRAQARFGTSALSPVIFLMDGEEDEAAAHELGVLDLLQKPVDVESLMSCITRIVKSRRTPEALT